MDQKNRFFNNAAPVYKQQKLKSELEVLVQEKMNRVQDVVVAQQEAIDNLAKWCSALDTDYREYQVTMTKRFRRLFWFGTAVSLITPILLLIKVFL